MNIKSLLSKDLGIQDRIAVNKLVMKHDIEKYERPEDKIKKLFKRVMLMNG